MCDLRAGVRACDVFVFERFGHTGLEVILSSGSCSSAQAHQCIVGAGWYIATTIPQIP